MGCGDQVNIEPNADGTLPSESHHVQVAFVIDGEVVEVMNTDPHLAAILMSQPEVVDVTGMTKNWHMGSIEAGIRFDGRSGAFFVPRDEVIGYAKGREPHMQEFNPNNLLDNQNQPPRPCGCGK